MASNYLLQIVDRRTNAVVQFQPGLAAEKVFITECVEKVLSRKVGFFRSAATVRQAVIDGIEQTIHELKAQIKQP